VKEVNEAWTGLGYYRRAKFLHEGAKELVRQHDGRLPRTAAELRKIPGIGPYTAGAIASIAYDQPAPLVDGNVIRVLSRLRYCHHSTAHAQPHTHTHAPPHTR
jgi:A/G-specific adenine glycosylase